MIESSLTLVRGLLQTLGHTSLAMQFIAVDAKQLHRLAHNLWHRSRDLPRDAAPMVHAAWLLIVALADYLERPAINTRAELESCIAEARGVVAPQIARAS